MTWTRQFAVLACAVGAVTLAIGIGVATGAKLKTESASKTLASEEFDGVSATCKPGTKAVSGGFHTESEFQEEWIVPYMSLAEGGRKWTSAGLNRGSPHEITSFAYCRNQKIERRSNETAVAGAEGAASFGTVTASCPKGTEVASGGFDNPDFFASGPDQTAIFPSESLKTGKREWTVSARNLGDIPGTLVVQVNCHERHALSTVAEELEIGPDGVSVVVATCAAGQRVVSGGFDIGSPLSSTTAFVFSSHKVGKRAWEVAVLNFDLRATLTAYAYCEEKRAKQL